jgi:hypothetical protein
MVVGHDDPAQGAGLAERALDLIDPVRCELAACHALVWFFGLGWEALDLLERSRPAVTGASSVTGASARADLSRPAPAGGQGRARRGPAHSS